MGVVAEDVELHSCCPYFTRSGADGGLGFYGFEVPLFPFGGKAFGVVTKCVDNGVLLLYASLENLKGPRDTWFRGGSGAVERFLGLRYGVCGLGCSHPPVTRDDESRKGS